MIVAHMPSGGSVNEMRCGTKVDVLWVEDSPSDRELALSLAHEALRGLAVLTIPDGLEALAWLQQQPRPFLPQVVILDLHLRNLDGLQVLRHIRENPRTRELPVVVFTSSTRPDHVVACYRAGANSYVVKPAAFEEYLRSFVHLATYWTKQNLKLPVD